MCYTFYNYKHNYTIKSSVCLFGVFVYYISPYVLLVLFNKNSILLLKRINKNFGNNCYSLVGGRVEQGETFRQALIREADEEIGITLKEKDLKFVHAFHRKGTDGELIALVFSTRKWVGNPFNREPEKHSEMIWCDLDNLPENLLPAHKQTLDCIKKKILYSEHD